MKNYFAIARKVNHDHELSFSAVFLMCTCCFDLMYMYVFGDIVHGFQVIMINFVKIFKFYGKMKYFPYMQYVAYYVHIQKYSWAIQSILKIFVVLYVMSFCKVYTCMSLVARKPVFGFPTRSNTNWAVQLYR